MNSRTAVRANDGKVISTLCSEEIMLGTAALRALFLVIGIAMLGAAGAHAQTAAAPDGADGARVEEIARQHFQLGRAQYESGQFREAAASFERAHELSKREVLWYNIYLAYRDAGDNAKAAEALRNYLTGVEQMDNRAHLEARLASLDRLVQEEQAREEQARAAEAAGRGAEPAQSAEPAATSDQPAEPPPADESPSIVPYVLLGVGGAMMIGGVVTGLMASSKHSELEEQCPNNPCDASLQDLADEGQTLALTADVLLFGGIAVAATGGVLWFLNRNASSDGEQPVAAAVGCGPRGCAGRVRVAF
jgi:tetratricopeptide (TPR) repeat protein